MTSPCCQVTEGLIGRRYCCDVVISAQGIHSQSGRSNCDHRFVYLCVDYWDLTFKQCHFFYSSCGEIEYVLSDLNQEAATLMKDSVSLKDVFFLIKINPYFDVNFSSV